MLRTPEPAPSDTCRLRQVSTWARDGLPFPLGVCWVEAVDSYNFALYSKHATRVSLLLYGEHDRLRPRHTLELEPLRHKSGRVWHCRVARHDMSDCVFYAYVVDGPPPQGPTEWHAFDPDKILIDPYARSIWFPPEHDRKAAMGPGANAGRAPLGVLPVAANGTPHGRAHRPWHDSDAIVYELHVKGFTAHPASGVAVDRRGTFAGLIDKIPYLVDLGVSVVELMPVQQNDPQGESFWGYMPLGLFAPQRSYARAAAELHGPVQEFRTMVEAFHDAGIEVVLDVVFNHTGEGDHLGPTYSFKGIDNSTYYLATGDPAAPYADFAGTGNAINCSNRYVRKMIVDCMRYWYQDLGVDGFRFDLASIFARTPDGRVNVEDPPIFGDIASENEFEESRLIAEPWDAAGGYQLGRSFPGLTWLQWNDRFRDDVRRFVRGDGDTLGALARRLYGSDDLFPDDLIHACRPYQSVNYVTCHDGFTLYDLVSYRHRHNWANGEGNRDGPGQEYSWNGGHEGDEDVPIAVLQRRARDARNLICLLLLANGTPMLRAGDEFLTSQQGNSNPHNQDNPIGWVDWSRRERFADMHAFVRGMIRFRRAHPSLARRCFWRDDVRWYGVQGPADFGPEARALAMFLDGGSEADDDLYVLINGSERDQVFRLQEPGPWRLALDTANGQPAEASGRHRVSEPRVAARSIVVLVRTAAGDRHEA